MLIRSFSSWVPLLESLPDGTSPDGIIESINYGDICAVVQEDTRPVEVGKDLFYQVYFKGRIGWVNLRHFERLRDDREEK